MKELNVLYQFDDNYAPYAGISIQSLYENNVDIEKLNVYCAAMNVSEENYKLLNETAQNYNRKLIFLDTKKSVEQIYKYSVGTWNGSLATWIKMFIIEDLIGKIDSLLYVDSDTLIVGSLKELCDFDFEGRAMACVIDSLSFESVKRLGIEEGKYYYNAGIMYFNLKYFVRNSACFSDMISHLEKNVVRYSVNDQDLLNDYFVNNIKQLSPKYNFQGIHFMYTDKVYYGAYGKYDYYTPEVIEEARNDVRIIHFFRALGDYPWAKGNYHPLDKLYHEWKAKSLWNTIEDIAVKRKLVYKVERILYKLLPKSIFLRVFKFITNSI